MLAKYMNAMMVVDLDICDSEALAASLPVDR